MKVARVAVNYPVKNAGLLYHYQGELQKGDLVEVPLGKRKSQGCVMALDEENSPEYQAAPKDKIRMIEGKISDLSLKPKDLALFEWMANYYHYSLGQLIFDCLPSTMKKPRPIKRILGEGKNLPFVLSSEQGHIISEVKKGSFQFNKFLIHGVTGSGKTAVYLELIKHTLNAGKSVLFLLPEINLTPQFTETFLQYTPAPIYSYHSELPDSQKYLIWKEARESMEPMLVLGVRSSVFIPINNLGLIIIDEEHDGSFKQDDRCPYNARDVASKKAQLLNIPIVMGSATPSLETYAYFHEPEHVKHLFELKNRAGQAYLPSIELVDARDKEDKPDEELWPLTPSSFQAIKTSIEKGEQVLVFVNRLGFANFLQCRACGHQFFCPNCSLTLRYFKAKNILSCQHCEYQEILPNQCQKCSSMTLIQKGFGTEKIQHVLQNLLPHVSIERFDRDEIKTFNQLENRLADFHSGKIQILVGTQMLSKGHNFERVKLVLILGIDGQLNFPDFRSNERVYQLLTQVAGRSGRYSQDGKVLIQTLNPTTQLFQHVRGHEFSAFYKEELEFRKICDCPPYKRLAVIHFSSRFQDRLIQHLSEKVTPLMKNLIAQHFSNVVILGPRPASVEKRSNQFTWTLLLKSDQPANLHNLLKTFEINYQKETSVSYKIDVDPYHLA